MADQTPKAGAVPAVAIRRPQHGRCRVVAVIDWRYAHALPVAEAVIAVCMSAHSRRSLPPATRWRSRRASCRPAVAGFASTLAFTAALAFGASADEPAARPSVRVVQNQLVDGTGRVLQLRGVNVAGFGLASVQAWAWVGNPRIYDNWGLQKPDWSVFATWGINTVRVPLNEASWLGLTTYDPVANDNGGADGHQHVAAGTPRRADPGGNYRREVGEAVQAATSRGLYVILDLHESGPDVSLHCIEAAAAPGQATARCESTTGARVPMTPFVPDYTQNPLPDADHAISFWTSVAETFKTFPNVLFDLYNEPFIEPWFSPAENQWDALLKGATVPFYRTGGTPEVIRESWRSAGMQSLVDAVRAAGATNVVLCGGLGYAGDMGGWLSHVPRDPRGQLAASWHAYPGSSIAGDSRSREPAWGTRQYGYVLDISRSYPVVIGETGDHNAEGTTGAPFVSVLLPWADAHGISYLGWSWNTWTAPNHVLIRNFDGTPTDGYGRYVRDHLRCAARRTPGSVPCP